jgi:sec-independent protein translocase protein TatC
MSFGDHLEDLRRRLTWALLGPVPIIIVCFFYGDALLDFLLRPVEAELRAAGQPTRLLATSPIEPFAAYLKVSIVVGLLASGPWILYQAWLFIAPGLYRTERRFVYFLIPFSAVLTLLGAVFLYYVLLPVSLAFLIRFGAALAPQKPGQIPLPQGFALPSLPVLEGDPASPEAGQVWINRRLQEIRIAIPRRALVEDPGVIDGDSSAEAPSARAPDASSDSTAAREPPLSVLGVPLSRSGAIAQQYRISEYVNLVFVLGVVFAIAFQLPLVMLLLGWTGIAEARDFTGKRRYVLFICAVSGAILTPADPFSMLLLAAPLYLLFEFGLLMMRVAPARRVAGEMEREGGDA